MDTKMNTVKIDYMPRYSYLDHEQWEGRWELLQGLPHARTPLISGIYG